MRLIAVQLPARSALPFPVALMLHHKPFVLTKCRAAATTVLLLPLCFAGLGCGVWRGLVAARRDPVPEGEERR